MSKRLTILWLDDQRDPNTYFKVKKPQSSVWVRNNDFYQNNIFNKYNVNFIWVKSFDEFVNYIETNGVPKFISFDNDLKNGRMTVDGVVPNGEDCVKWLINYCNDNGLKLPKYYLHTANHKQRDVLNKLLKESVKMKKVVLNETKIKKIVKECLLNVLKETKMYGYEIPGDREDAEVELDNTRKLEMNEGIYYPKSRPNDDINVDVMLDVIYDMSMDDYFKSPESCEEFCKDFIGFCDVKRLLKYMNSLYN